MEPQFRSYVPGDESQVLALFREVFGESRSDACWRWQFQENCAGPPIISIAVEDGSIFGHMGIMRQDWSLKGRRVPAGYGCDNMVSARARGKGVFTKLFGINEQLARQQGLYGVVGFTSRNTWPSAYVPLVTRGGYERVVQLKAYRMRTGLRQLGPLATLPWTVARSVRNEWERRRAPARLEVHVSDRVPEGIDECLERFRAHEVVCVWKDSTYLKWRYEAHPEFKYLFHSLRSRQGLEGFAVTRSCGRTLAVCDVVHRRKDIWETAFFLREIAARRHGAEGALGVEFFGWDNGFFEASFVAAGFEMTAFSPHTFLCLPLEAEKALPGCGAAVPHNWSLAYGDSDMV